MHHRSNAPQTIISMEVLYCIGTAAFKYSALLLFHRIFGSVPRFTTFLWFFAFVILANNIAEIFLSIFRTYFSAMILSVLYQIWITRCFWSKRTILLPGPVCSPHFLPRISNTDSETCVECTPVHKAWDLDVEGSCVNILLAACIPASINVVSDVVTFLLPLPLIWNLHLERNRKVQLLGIFLLSGL